MKAVIILLFILSMFQVEAYSQTLWKNAKYGMTFKQVQLIFPKGSQPKEKRENGLEHLWDIDNVEVSSVHFIVKFYFMENKLKEIVLETDISPGMFYAGRLKFDELFNVLKSKYGEPLSSKDETIGERTYLDANWIKGNLSILLSCWGKEMEKPNFTIVYGSVKQNV